MMKLKYLLKKKGVHHEITPVATTAYYLYKIEHPLNGKINFEYTNYHSKIATKQFQSWAQYNYPESINDVSRAGFWYGSGCLKQISNKNPYPTVPGRVYNIIDGKYLSKIFSPNTTTKISFNLGSSKNGRFNFNKILSGFEVKNNTTLFDKIDFDYYYNTNASSGITQRFFLKKVVINKDNHTRKFQEYKFIYKDWYILSNRFSYKQDHLGYYNNKNNNEMFPKNSNPLFTGVNADRDSDFEIRSAGTLSKIIYPTRGFTKIEYEAPLTKQILKKNVNLETHINGFENYVYNKTTDTYNVGGLFVGEDGSPVEESTFVTETVAINVDVFSETSLVLHHSILINFDIIDVTDANHPKTTHNTITINDDGVENDNFDGEYYVYQNTYSFEFKKNHKYIINLHLDPDNIQTKLGATLKFTYTERYELKDGEGIRVKRVSDYKNGSDTPKNTKRYYYTKAQNILKDPLEYVPIYLKPKYLTSGELLIVFPLNIDCLTSETNESVCGDVYGHTATSLNIYPDNYPDNAIYKYVTISYGGDNFENGGSSKEFYIDKDWDGDHVEDTYDDNITSDNYKDSIFNPITITNNPYVKSFTFNKMKEQYRFSEWKSVQKGDLLTQNVYKLSNGNIFKIIETNYEKEYLSANSLNCYLGVGVNACGYHHHRYLHFGMGLYKFHSRKISSSLQTTKTYIDPYPMVENELGILPDESNYRKIVTTQTIKYNSEYKGLPTKIEITGKLPNETVIVENKYVDKRGNLSNPRGQQVPLSSDEMLAYNELVNIHNISQPIETATFIKKGSELNKRINTKRTLYQITQNGKVVPKTIQTSKGLDDLEDRIVFTDYDNNGNLTEVSYKDGSKTKYRYNFRGQVLEKIGNYIANNGTPIGAYDTTSDCSRAVNYPNSLVTTYQYNNVTHLLESITNPRCETMYYEYDAFHRLQYIKDNDGNVLKEYDYNYRR